MAVNSTQARPIIVEALKRTLGREPTLAEVYAVQAVARFDGGYGNFSSPPHGPEGTSSNNWGAVQHSDLVKHRIWRGNANPKRDDPEVAKLLNTPAPASPQPTEWFYASDFYGPPHGQGWFWGPYRVYPNPVDGAAHVARLLNKMGVLEVANTQRNWVAIARQMRAKNYFIGYSDKTREENIRDYARNLKKGGDHFVALFGETSPVGWDTAPLAGPPAVLPPGVVESVPVSSSLYSQEEHMLPILRQGADLSDAVRLWQRILHIKADGIFGVHTHQMTLEFQRERFVTIDGIVGPQTWGAAP